MSNVSYAADLARADLEPRPLSAPVLSAPADGAALVAMSSAAAGAAPRARSANAIPLAQAGIANHRAQVRLVGIGTQPGRTEIGLIVSGGRGLRRPGIGNGHRLDGRLACRRDARGTTGHLGRAGREDRRRGRRFVGHQDAEERLRQLVRKGLGERIQHITGHLQPLVQGRWTHGAELCRELGERAPVLAPHRQCRVCGDVAR